MKHVKEATATAQPSDKGKGRLLALDILRGITIAGMIMVNNPGSWGHIYAPLRHAEWNGLTPTDLVFPFFMFIMGVSTYFSLRKYDFRLSKAALWKILRRAIVIFAIGLGIAWFGRFLRGLYAGDGLWNAVNNFDHIRILGVMPRLALCYGIGALAALICRPRTIPWLIAILLVGYTIVLLVGHGYEFSENSILYIVDNAVLGENHTYTDTIGGTSLHLDPEGLLSTIPAIAHMLIGFLCGSLLLKTKDNTKRINSLFIVGVILTFSGLLLEYGLPINKKVWSPTFVLTTCGLASSFLALLIWIIDIKGYKRWCRFFEVFGINPLFMYCLGAVLGILIGTIRIPSEAAVDGVTTLKGMVYNDWLVPLCGDATLASLIFALLFIALNWSIGLILYKKKIYIKI